MTWLSLSNVPSAIKEQYPELYKWLPTTTPTATAPTTSGSTTQSVNNTTPSPENAYGMSNWQSMNIFERAANPQLNPAVQQNQQNYLNAMNEAIQGLKLYSGAPGTSPTPIKTTQPPASTTPIPTLPTIPSPQTSPQEALNLSNSILDYLGRGTTGNVYAPEYSSQAIADLTSKFATALDPYYQRAGAQIAAQMPGMLSGTPYMNKLQLLQGQKLSDIGNFTTGLLRDALGATRDERLLAEQRAYEDPYRVANLVGTFMGTPTLAGRSLLDELATSDLQRYWYPSTFTGLTPWGDSTLSGRSQTLSEKQQAWLQSPEYRDFQLRLARESRPPEEKGGFSFVVEVSF